MVDSGILLKMLEFFIDNIYFKSYRRDFHQTVVGGGLMAFNWRSFLSVEETRVHGGNHQLCIRVCIMYGSSMYAVSITAIVSRLIPTNSKVYSIQHYVNKFVNDLR